MDDFNTEIKKKRNTFDEFIQMDSRAINRFVTFEQIVIRITCRHLFSKSFVIFMNKISFKNLTVSIFSFPYF